jgi:Icc-related predicted phosphoesterase
VGQNKLPKWATLECQSQLLDGVMRVRPKLHVFGHIHGAYGVFQTEHTTFVNASLLGVHGDVDRAPFVFEMTRK